jgi:hypothetical protein
MNDEHPTVLTSGTDAGSGGDEPHLHSLDTGFDWKVIPVPASGTGHLAVGPLHLHLRMADGELRIGHGTATEGAEGARWSRWAPREEWNRELRLRPALPARTIVVRPEEEFWLGQGASARIYVRIPVWVQIEAGDRPDAALLTLPTQVLSDTWWGSAEEGELCYYLQTTARRVMRPDEFPEHLCVCAVQLVNDSDHALLVDRIALRTAYLAIYRDGERLLGTTTRVRYRGAELESELSVEEGPPADAGSPVLMTPAPERMARGFTARTFARLRSSLGEWI